MEAEDQQDATVRTGGQTDGSSDAAKNWRRIQNAYAQSETRMPQVAEDPWETEPISVAREMVETQKEDEEMATVWAAQILEERFLQSDEEDKDRRRQEFTVQVQEHFIWMEAEWRQEQKQQADVDEVCIENQDRVVDWWLQVVYIANLAGGANKKMLKETFGQIGLVLEAGVEREGCGWVKFQEVDDALEAVERFDGVVYAKQAMVCGSSESVWEAQADY